MLQDFRLQKTNSAIFSENFFKFPKIMVDRMDTPPTSHSKLQSTSTLNIAFAKIYSTKFIF